MTVGKKLTISFAAMSAVTLVLGASSLIAIRSLSSNLEKAVNTTTRKIQLIDDMSGARSDMLAGQRGVVMFSFGKDAARAAKAKLLFETSAQRWADALSEVRPLLVTEEGRRMSEQMAKDLASWREAFEELERACGSGKPAEGMRIAVVKGVPLYESSGRAAARLREIQRGIFETSQHEAARLETSSVWITVAVILISIGFGIAVVFVIRGLNKTLQSVTGELTQGSQQIASAAGQVASSSQSLAQGSSEQATSLEETSASAEEITSMTRKNAENSKSAAELMATVDHEIQQGNKTLEQMVASMEEINASSEKISKIIKVIDEIAFQTNILALNAAVEAARAGEAGMGFAVVADEVRNLAQRSAQAAKDTAGLIEESIATSHDGSEKLQKVADVIRSITDSATEVKTLVDEVNMGSQEQARGIDQIAKAVAQMDQVTQGTAASAEESASASEELSAQAQALNQIVSNLEALVGGAHSHGISAELKRPLKSAGLSKSIPAPGLSRHKRETEEFPLHDNFREM